MSSKLIYLLKLSTKSLNFGNHEISAHAVNKQTVNSKISKIK